MTKANKFRDHMIHDSMLIDDSEGRSSVPLFYLYFDQSVHRRNSNLFSKLLKQIPKNHRKIWLDRFFKNKIFQSHI